MKKKIINSILIIIMASLIGVGLLTASFMLPEASIQSNAKASSIVLTYEGMYPRMIDGIETTKMDNYTDAIMINSASFDYGDYSALKKASGAYHFEVDWSDDPTTHLYERFNDNK